MQGLQARATAPGLMDGLNASLSLCISQDDLVSVQYLLSVWFCTCMVSSLGSKKDFIEFGSRLNHESLFCCCSLYSMAKIQNYSLL